MSLSRNAVASCTLDESMPVPYLQKYFFLIRDEKLRASGIAALFLFAAVLDAIGLGMVVPLVATMFGEPADTPAVLLWGVESTLPLLGVGLILVFALRGVVGVAVQYSIVRFASNKHAKIMASIVEAHVNRGIEAGLSASSDALIKRLVTSSALYVNDTLITSFRAVADKVVLLVIFSVLAYLYPLPLLLLVTIFALIFGMYAIGVKRKVEESGSEMLNAQERMISIAREIYTGLVDITQYGVTSRYTDEMARHAGRYARKGARYYALLAIPRYLVELAFVVFVVLVLIEIAIRQGDIVTGISIVSVFAAGGIRAVPSASSLMYAYGKMQYSKPALFEVYEEMAQISGALGQPGQSKPDGRVAITDIQNLELIDVDFSYGKNNTNGFAIRGVSLTVNKGECICIMGHSGSGKSTLLAVLAGHLKPVAGNLTVSGPDGNCEPLSYYTNNIAIVTQYPFIADASLNENVSFFAKGVESESVLDALLAAGFRLDSDRTEHPLEGKTLGEGGRALSGGERQRLVIARALFHRKQVILFDEPISALDDVAAQKVVDTIARIKKSHIVIIASHDERVRKICDRAFRLSDGELHSLD